VTEEIDVLSAIPSAARSVLKLPSGVVLRMIAIEIILACLPNGACRTLHFANPLFKSTSHATPFTPLYIFLFHLTGCRFTKENTLLCTAEMDVRTELFIQQQFRSLFH